MVARKLISQGYDGPITMVCGEHYRPYERPPLSKAVLSCNDVPAPLPPSILKDDAGMPSSRLTFRLGQHATGIDRQAKTVRLDSGESLPFDKLVIATGGRPRLLTVPGSTGKGVHYLRTLDDANSLRAKLLTSDSLLVIGGGWIGLEVAATARSFNKKVVLLEMDSRLCRRSLPEPVAHFLADYHRKQGVDIRFGLAVEKFIADENGNVAAAFLTDGTRIDADLVVVGIGLIPNTDIAEAAGLQVRSGLVVDAVGRTSDPSIYAAGDVAERECPWHGGSIRLESWQNANIHADIVASSILGAPLPAPEPPWFWSDQYGLNIQVSGVPSLGDTVIERDRTGDTLLSIHLRGNKICGAVSINRTRELKIITQAMMRGASINPGELSDSSRPLREVLLTSKHL
jgi:3-phenylpropionate/trans-cinnamate dioxygenase ferredoxin reductase subunit